VEHIKLEENSEITLDFLGKDSMRYCNTVKVDEIVWKNLGDFIKGKKKTDDLFDKINAGSLNDYLRNLMEGLTAKVFRTYNASFTLERELMKKDLEKFTLEEKVNYYDEANKQVAILCNHQKTVPKNFDLMKEKLAERVFLMKIFIYL
jgi:DNA topoisomerase-1